jgi:hypothetical protein
VNGPDDGPGSYRFRARIRNDATGKIGGWSSYALEPGCPRELTVT